MHLFFKFFCLKRKKNYKKDSILTRNTRTLIALNISILYLVMHTGIRCFLMLLCYYVCIDKWCVGIDKRQTKCARLWSTSMTLSRQSFTTTTNTSRLRLSWEVPETKQCMHNRSWVSLQSPMFDINTYSSSSKLSVFVYNDTNDNVMQYLCLCWRH